MTESHGTRNNICFLYKEEIIIFSFLEICPFWITHLLFTIKYVLILRMTFTGIRCVTVKNVCDDTTWPDYGPPYPLCFVIFHHLVIYDNTKHGMSPIEVHCRWTRQSQVPNKFWKYSTSSHEKCITTSQWHL